MSDPRPDNPAPAVPASGHSVRTKSMDAANLLALRLIAANARLNAIALVTTVVLIVLGLWVYSGVKQSLREIRAAELQTMLESERKTLQVWVDDRKANVEHWANDPRVRRHVERLAALGSSQPVYGDALWNAPERAALVEVLAPVLKEAGGIAFNAIDTTGLIIATQYKEYSGRRVNPGNYLAYLDEVFKGKAHFIRPYPENERVKNSPSLAFSRPVIWFEAPVRNARGEVIAALGFAHYADSQFANIMNMAHPGKTGEMYAFDASGVMLSESRFLVDLKKIGLVPDDVDAGAMLRVQIRDPGGNLAEGYRPAVELEARPLTRVAALAIASRHKPELEKRRGVILDTYRNYRGAEVIGAWKWIADYDFGVAVEVGADEAYAPLVYLNLAFAVILSLLAIAVGAVLWSSLYVRRLRRQVGDARVIGQYRLEKQIGEGGMSKVYLARHALLKRPTALKMLKRHLASDEIVTRFEREVQLASQLVHPNTVEIYDYGRTRDGVFYYVMEYLEGLTLGQLVVEGGPMPAGRVIHVLRQVCAALREAHGRGLIHRDIKPHNIMLCQRGGEYDVIKLLDFGLVKDVLGRQSRDITQFQKMLGTPLYMSPERIRNPGDADARADIYSVGVVGFYLLTGRDLFETTSQHDLTYHILHAPPRRPSQCGVAAVPPGLDDTVFRCLAKDRAERPQNVAELIAALDTLASAYPWTQQDAAGWWKRRESAARSAPAAVAPEG